MHGERRHHLYLEIERSVHLHTTSSPGLLLDDFQNGGSSASRGQLMAADKCINTEIGDCSDTTEQNNYAFFNTSKLLRGEFGTFLTKYSFFHPQMMYLTFEKSDSSVETCKSAKVASARPPEMRK